MEATHQRRDRFEAIADEVFEPLQRYLRRRIGPDQAEDVLSETMLALWRRLDDVPSGRALPWCYGIARRTLANATRGERRRLRLLNRLEAESVGVMEADPSETGPDHVLETALDRLSHHDRELLRLWAWEQLEPREIALVINISVNAATLRLSRAKKRLAAHLSGQSSDSAGHEQLKGTQET